MTRSENKFIMVSVGGTAIPGEVNTLLPLTDKITGYKGYVYENLYNFKL